jgi:hypothetical protein
MLILYFIVCLIGLYFTYKEFEIFKLNNLIDNFGEIFILTNTDVCKYNIYLKLYRYCNICRLPNVINLENLDDLMRLLTIITVKKQKECNIIIHTEGGQCSAIDAVSRLLSESKCKINTFIPQYAYSAGTLIAICGNKLYMNWYSLLGPIDSQIYYDDEESFSAKYVKEFNNKDGTESKDFLKGLQAKAYHNDDEELLENILKNNTNKGKIKKRLLNTKFSHLKSYTRNDIKEMGLPVINDVPKKIMEIFDLYQLVM